MKLEQLVHAVENRLFGWFTNDQQLETSDERRDLLAAIRTAQLERDRLHDQQVLLRSHVEQLVQAVSLLPSSIENSHTRGKASQAMRQSLELENKRKELEQSREELASLERILWSHDFRLRHLRKKLAALPSPFVNERKSKRR